MQNFKAVETRGRRQELLESFAGSRFNAFEYVVIYAMACNKDFLYIAGGLKTD